MEEKILEEMKEVQEMGGMVKCISSGLIQRKVSRQAYEFEKGIQSGEYKKVGLDPEAADKETEKTNAGAAGAVELHEYNEEWANKSKANLKELRRTRNDKDVTDSLKTLEQAAKGSDNVMPCLVKCCHAYATVGEMAGVFRQTFGEWNEPEFY
jgi:methylmalonyl-CoA mutase N-terminal domain/subunit